MREGWEYQKLGELVKVINGLWVGKKPPFTNVAVVRNANFTKSCTLDMSNIAYIDVEEKQFNTRELQYADIIIEKSGGSEKQPVGRPVFFNIKDRGYSFSNFTATLRVVSSDIVPEYLYKVLLAQYKQGVTKRLQSKTTGLHNLDFKSYLKSVIPIPSCEKQLSIVSELDKINELIRLKKEQLKDYDNLAQSIFYEMFGDPIENEKGWEVKKLGDVCKFTQGTQVPIEEQHLSKENGLVQFLRIIDFTQGKDAPRFVKCSNDKYILHEREIAIVRYGTPGFVCYGKIGAIANNLFKITPNQKDMFEFEFLVHWLNTEAFQSAVKSKQYGAALQAIKFSTIQGINIIIPSLTVQRSFATRISQIDKQKQYIEESIKELESLLASRMQYWFD